MSNIVATDSDGVDHRLIEVDPGSWACKSERSPCRYHLPCWWWTDAPSNLDAFESWLKHIKAGPVTGP